MPSTGKPFRKSVNHLRRVRAPMAPTGKPSREDFPVRGALGRARAAATGQPFPFASHYAFDGKTFLRPSQLAPLASTGKPFRKSVSRLRGGPRADGADRETY